jgi:hypothetical protein
MSLILGVTWLFSFCLLRAGEASYATRFLWISGILGAVLTVSMLDSLCGCQSPLVAPVLISRPNVFEFVTMHYNDADDLLHERAQKFCEQYACKSAFCQLQPSKCKQKKIENKYSFDVHECGDCALHLGRRLVRLKTIVLKRTAAAQSILRQLTDLVTTVKVGPQDVLGMRFSPFGDAKEQTDEFVEDYDLEFPPLRAAASGKFAEQIEALIHRYRSILAGCVSAVAIIALPFFSEDHCCPATTVGQAFHHKPNGFTIVHMGCAIAIMISRKCSAHAQPLPMRVVSTASLEYLSREQSL